MNFGHMLAAIDNITSAEMKKVTSLGKSGRVDQAELYTVAKKSIASLKSAKYGLFTTSLPEDLPNEVSNHLGDSKNAMDMVIHYRMRVSEALMEYLDDPKPSHAAKMKEYVDAIYPEQLKSAEALTKAGALVGITYNDLFPSGLGSHSSKNAHNNPFAGSDKPNKSGKGKSRKHEK